MIWFFLETLSYEWKQKHIFCFIIFFATFWRKLGILIPDMYLYSIKTQTDINKKYMEKITNSWNDFFCWAGPGPVILGWAGAARPSKQWRISPLFILQNSGGHGAEEEEERGEESGRVDLAATHNGAALDAGGNGGGRTQLQTMASRWFYSFLLCFPILSILPPSLNFCLRLSIFVSLCSCSFFFLFPLSFSRHSPLSRSLFSIRLFSLFFFCLSPSFCYCPPSLFFFLFFHSPLSLPVLPSVKICPSVPSIFLLKMSPVFQFSPLCSSLQTSPVFLFSPLCSSLQTTHVSFWIFIYLF